VRPFRSGDGGGSGIEVAKDRGYLSAAAMEALGGCRVRGC
jgi:hypothetical protein